MGGEYYLMNIWMVKFLLVQQSNKLKFQCIKKLYIKLMYKLKYKYKYMNNLILSFENLFILLEYKKYKIEIDNDISVRMSIQKKNILFIESNDYSIRINIDKISWKLEMKVRDLNSGNQYYVDSNMRDSIEKSLPKHTNRQAIYTLFNYIFNTIFNNFINE